VSQASQLPNAVMSLAPSIAWASQGNPFTIRPRLGHDLVVAVRVVGCHDYDAFCAAGTDVAQCVCFAVPRAKLGEDVAVAIVLREAATAAEHSIKEFCASRLAKFKVPETIVFLEEIPKGATGKLQRIGLAAKLGLA
jgi:acyl-CoA synthetase (AMP-forming)/AMP-acid ligase II